MFVFDLRSSTGLSGIFLFRLRSSTGFSGNGAAAAPPYNKTMYANGDRWDAGGSLGSRLARVGVRWGWGSLALGFVEIEVCWELGFAGTCGEKCLLIRAKRGENSFESRFQLKFSQTNNMFRSRQGKSKSSS